MRWSQNVPHDHWQILSPSDYIVVYYRYSLCFLNLKANMCTAEVSRRYSEPKETTHRYLSHNRSHFISGEKRIFNKIEIPSTNKPRSLFPKTTQCQVWLTQCCLKTHTTVTYIQTAIRNMWMVFAYTVMDLYFPITEPFRFKCICSMTGWGYMWTGPPPYSGTPLL